MLSSVEVRAVCVMGCATRRLRVHVSAADIAGRIKLPSCSCGSDVLLISAVQFDYRHEVVFNPPISPRELSEALFDIVLPPEGDT